MKKYTVSNIFSDFFCMILLKYHKLCLETKSHGDSPRNVESVAHFTFLVFSYLCKGKKWLFGAYLGISEFIGMIFSLTWIKISNIVKPKFPEIKFIENFASHNCLGGKKGVCSWFKLINSVMLLTSLLKIFCNKMPDTQGRLRLLLAHFIYFLSWQEKKSFL